MYTRLAGSSKDIRPFYMHIFLTLSIMYFFYPDIKTTESFALNFIE